MPLLLKRYQSAGNFHFLTFSCDQRRPYFRTPGSRDLFERSLEQTRANYSFDIFGYVVMPEHIHLLVSEPTKAPLSRAIQALKVSVSKQSKQRPFWLVRYHDFNVITLGKHLEKLRYLHRNPVTRGLVETPEAWPHSSYLTYATRTQRTVHITLE
jgi:putative transposase